MFSHVTPSAGSTIISLQVSNLGAKWAPSLGRYELKESWRVNRATVLSVVPQLAAEGTSPERVAAYSWRVEAAETVLFERLKIQERDELSPERSRNELAASRHQSGYVPPPAHWKDFGMLYAAGILLFLALTITSYRLGTQQGARTATVSMANGNRTAGIVPGRVASPDLPAVR
jgi:hypothetical protein